MVSQVVSPSPAERPLADADDRMRAVTARDRNLLVTAGAGTGKTALLTERLLNLFFRRDDPAAPAQCAALTFTHRAAGEMADRLREYLERFLDWAAGGGPEPGREEVPARIYREIAGRHGWTDEEMGEIARRTLRDLELASISTYHSFAARLLKLYPLPAGVDPFFVEDDGTVFEERFARRWEEWLAGELWVGGPREALWRRTLGAFDLSALGELAKRLCAETISLESLEGALGDGTFFEAPGGWLEGEIGAARELTGRFEENRKIQDWTRKAVEVLEAFAGGAPEEDVRNLAARIQGNMPGKVQSISPEDYEACKRVITLARGVASLDRRAVEDALAALLPFAREFREDFVRSGHLTFDGLLVRARDLLRDHREIRRELKDRFRHLLVDEFQDTDPLQYEIVLYLAEARGAEAGDWRDVRLEAGKLFIVGDPKQSIYSFRGADIEAYQTLVERVIEGERLALRVNFRSHDRIVGAVNGMFGRLIREREAVQPGYLPAEPRPGGPAALEAQKVEVRVVRPEPGRTWNAEEAAEGEARELARWIREDLVGRAEIPDPSGETRPVRYGDVAVLLRKMTGIGPYVNALRERAVPHVVETGRGFFETQEVTDFLNLLASLAYPEDRLALAGVLRSPLGGLADKELYDWARGARGGGGGAAASVPPKASSLIERLDRVRAEIRLLPVAAALDRVLSAFPVLESAALLAGEQGRNNVLKVRALAIQRAERLDVGFSALVDWLRGRGSEVRDEGESPLAEEGIDAVKLLTVHKAKGLEFPVVVLAGLQARSRAGRAGVRLSRDWSRGVWALRIGDVRTLGMVWAEDRDDSTSDAEERRLFYVAATRARERLVFSAAVRHGRGGKPAEAKDLLAYLNEALGADVRDGGADSYTVGDGRVERVCVTPPPDAAVADEGGEEVSLPEGLEAAWRARRERAEGARRLRLDVRPSDLGDEEGGFGKPDSETEGVPREAAIRVGIVVHGVMEGIDLKGPAKDLDGLVRTVLEGAFPEIPEAEARRIHREAKEIVEGFLASADFGTKIRPCEVLGREVPCFLPGDGEGGMGGAVEGYADLVLRDDRGIWVIDYKTDRIDPSEAERRAEAHLPQGRFYARALSRALGTEVRRFGVAFLRPAVVVELEVGEG